MRYDLHGQLQGHKAKAVPYGAKIHALAADGIFGLGGRGDQKRKRDGKSYLCLPIKPASPSEQEELVLR